MKTQIIPSFIEDEMQRSYLDYAMSVIVGRALPDVRDGLKPVHRRILYAMKLGGYEASKPHKKSARVVGDVMSQFHPHGDAAIYDAMVRMAQEFSMRLPLVDGQGNFGSLDGDPPAAMRYTEARLTSAAEAILADTDQHTVKFQPNYDESVNEPTVLASQLPNLMINGSSGIAVGMATNIPPHNLEEVINGCCALIDSPDLSSVDLLQYVRGPDFPTGALIMGRRGIVDACKSGRGSLILRARTTVEELRKDRPAIIVTEIPYQVNKARMLERMGDAVNHKIISGIADIRDESDRDGLRVVIELKRDAIADVVRNQLFRHTQLQTTFAVNTLALRDGRPELLDLRTALTSFLEFREQVIRQRSQYELTKARDQANILTGFAIAIDNLDSMIELIRQSSDSSGARQAILDRPWDVTHARELIEDQQVIKEGYRLSEAQVRAILDLRLSRLTALERGKNTQSLLQLNQQIEYYQALLDDRSRLLELMRSELVEIKQRFSSPRRSEIVDVDDDGLQLTHEDLIPSEEMVVTVSRSGYAKRVSLSTYRAQQRGGKGRSGMRVTDKDAVAEMFVAKTHDTLLLLSTRGLAYALRVYRLPLSTPQSTGKSLHNFLPLKENERISATLVLSSPDPQASIVFATAKGYVRRNRLTDFLNIRSNGLITMKMHEQDRLIGAVICCRGHDLLLATHGGRALRFQLDQLRIFSGRNSPGVRGIKLASNDRIISLSVVRQVETTAQEREAYLKVRRLVENYLNGVRSWTEDYLKEQKTAGDMIAANAPYGPLPQWPGLPVQLRGLLTEELGLQSVEDLTKQFCLQLTGQEKQARERHLQNLARKFGLQLAEQEKLTRERYLQLAEQEEMILTVSERGFGKLSSAYEYRTAGRDGQGIWSMKANAKVGNTAAAIFPVELEQDIMLMTDRGQVVRMPVTAMRVAGRHTSGVTLFRIGEQERIVSAALIPQALGSEEPTEY